MANLERVVGWVCFASVFVFNLICGVSSNAEGDALAALKTKFTDPNNVLQSWNSNHHFCTWFNVTCNSENSVTHIDLGNANLSGQLVPQLGQLPNLQYLALFSNNITGRIPEELGNLTNLVSLELYLNSLIGPIPPTLGKLSKLRFFFANNRLNQPPVSPPPIRTTPSAAPSGSITTGAIAWGVAAGALLLFAGPAFARV